MQIHPQSQPPLKLKPCNEIGCSELVEVLDRGRPVYCEVHLAKYYVKNRGRYRRVKYSSDWQSVRRTFLRKNPYCQCRSVDCGVCHGSHVAAQVPAVDVHHIVRLSTWQDKRAANRHLQALCKPCHGSTTAAELRRDG
jgi:5-methylcytosine-specific restriction endonuclease McrA